MHKVFVMAENFERQLNLTNLSMNGVEINHADAIQNSQNTTDDIVTAINYFNSKKNVNGGGGTNKNARCTYCGMTDHIIEKCYKKHGYPPGWIPRYKSKGKQPVSVATMNS